MNRGLASASWARAALAGAAGGVAWLVGIGLFFWPVQGILTDPSHQSAKFLAAFGEPPLPRIADLPWLLPVGLVIVGTASGLAYHLQAGSGTGSVWRRGRRFGLLAWLVAIPWFEFYLPFNVMREPVPLVMLELLCWFLVLQLVGTTIALVYHGRRTEAGELQSRERVAPSS